MTEHDTLSDENWSASVEFDIELWEQSQYVVWQEDDVPSVEIRARYPTNSYQLSFPFFSLLVDRDAQLERVVLRRFDAGYGPTLCGIYSNETVVIKTPGNDGFKHTTYAKWNRRSGASDEVLWDALDEDTTDPLCDISLGDEDVDGMPSRTRPWDES